MMHTLCLLLAAFVPFIGGNVPDEFTVKSERLGKSNHLFTLETSGQKPFATIHQDGPLFRYATLAGVPIANGELVTAPPDDTLIMVDPEGKLIGTIERRTFPFAPAHYLLRSPTNTLIAEGRFNITGTRLTLANPENPYIEYVTFSRNPFSLFGDYWSATIHDHALDERLLPLVAAFQSYLDLRHRGI